MATKKKATTKAAAKKTAAPAQAQAGHKEMLDAIVAHDTQQANGVVQRLMDEAKARRVSAALSEFEGMNAVPHSSTSEAEIHAISISGADLKAALSVPRPTALDKILAGVTAAVEAVKAVRVSGAEAAAQQREARRVERKQQKGY